MHVLDYERASEVIGTAQHMGVGVCYCRHKAEHVGKACKAPMNICMTFGGSADSLIRHGYARRVDKAEGMDLLAQAYESRLVQFGENVQRDAGFICNCCGCCCEAMIAQRRFGSLNPVHTTNYLPHVDEATCNGCGKCVDTCPVEAMTLVSANDPAKPRKRRAELAAEICLGCGVCTRVCTHKALWLEPRPERVVTPVDTLHRTVLMAIERGRLQDCIFDNRALLSHRAMAGDPGRDPQAAADEAGARDPADPVPLPREAPGAREGLERGAAGPPADSGATRVRGCAPGSGACRHRSPRRRPSRRSGCRGPPPRHR